MPLSRRQFRDLMSGLAELYRPGAGDFPVRVVSVLRATAGADSYSYNHFGPGGPLGVHAEPVDGPTFPGAYTVFKQHVHQHPVLGYFRDTGDGAARRISDFLSDRQFRSLALYGEFYRHTGVNYQVVITMPLPGGGLIAAAVGRQGSDFSAEELERLDLLRPHIAQAAAAAGVLRVPPPSALCDPDGTPLLTARQASIVRLVAAGQADRQIARSLGISTRTVHAHLQNIYRALGVSSRTEALARLRSG
jgi:DNA-binding CsgD family transcriptional regulator